MFLGQIIRPGLFQRVANQQNIEQLRTFQTSLTAQLINRMKDRRTLIRTMPKRDEGIDGVSSIAIGKRDTFGEFPDIGLPERLFDGIPFNELPVVAINVTKNNTTITLNRGGEAIAIHSGGREGYTGCRKGTNVAAQAAANSLCKSAFSKGIKTVRVTIRGLGPGRLPSIKAIATGGLNVVSITDTCPISNQYPRPRKVRRV